MKAILFSLLPLALVVAQCHKHDPDPAKPEDQLPAATQTGADTFGCLVDGQPWLPSGNNGTPNSVALYDSSVNSADGAQINIKAYRLAATETYMTLYFRKIDSQMRTFTMNLPPFGQPVTEAFGCYEGSFGSFCVSSLTYLSGQIVLTRIDEKAGVIAGTFWFTALQKGNSDTLKVTKGRFDYKI